ncbi:MAG: ChrR family anti-sigma-E factor [Porticoccaceae bacterium]|jgi:putative transcriptional regulator|nr:ChrR family anti-sigma-E factor [Porticoccaceae bacterium]
MNNTSQFHPDDTMLLEFSAGTLATAPSICVSAHLHFCSKCRAQLLRLDQVGSQLMSEAEPLELEEGTFDKVMANLDSSQQIPVKVDSQQNNYPFSVTKLLKNNLVSQTWKRLSSSVDVARFETGQEDFEVALHKICAGGKTPKHDHHGLEYTVVLKGSFSDENAVYREGDFLIRQPGDVHQPMGAQNGECICLSALSAPIKLTNPLGFLMKPWLRINPM